ncbi:MAG: hypothetical protein QM477_11965 [Planctomycetota bacterium]
MVEPAPRSILSRPKDFVLDGQVFATEGPRQALVSVVLLPDRTPVAQVPFWGTPMNSWEVRVGTTGAQGTALVALPAVGPWEFSCEAPGLGSGRTTKLDSYRNGESYVVELTPYPVSLHLRAVDAVSGKLIPSASFSSRHQNPDVLAFQEPLANLPAKLLSEGGVLKHRLEYPGMAYLLIEAEGYLPAVVSIFEQGEFEVPMHRLEAIPLQVTEGGHPVAAQVEFQFAAASYRFGQYAHTTLRPPERYFLETSAHQATEILLPPATLRSALFIHAESMETGRIHAWSFLEVPTLLHGMWVLKL